MSDTPTPERTEAEELLDELGDDELHARLTQRGVDPGTADRIIGHRDTEAGRAAAIDALLGLS